jgi:colicin import membrane protein
MLILRVLSMVCRSPDDGVSGGGGGGADAGAGGGGENRSEAGLLAALQAERKAGQDLKAQIAKIDADRKAEADAAAAKSGEYKALYEPLKAEHESAKGRLAEFEKREADRTERVKARNEIRIKALPEAAAKALAPLAANLAPEALADWMDEHLSALVAEAGTTRPAGTVAGGGGKKVEDPIPAAATESWERHGKRLGQSERDYFERVWKPRNPTKK